jgi:hypothetical protein
MIGITIKPVLIQLDKVKELSCEQGFYICVPEGIDMAVAQLLADEWESRMRAYFSDATPWPPMPLALAVQEVSDFTEKQVALLTEANVNRFATDDEGTGVIVKGLFSRYASIKTINVMWAMEEIESAWRVYCSTPDLENNKKIVFSYALTRISNRSGCSHSHKFTWKQQCEIQWNLNQTPGGPCLHLELTEYAHTLVI